MWRKTRSLPAAEPWRPFLWPHAAIFHRSRCDLHPAHRPRKKLPPAEVGPADKERTHRPDRAWKSVAAPTQDNPPIRFATIANLDHPPSTRSVQRDPRAHRDAIRRSDPMSPASSAPQHFSSCRRNRKKQFLNQVQPRTCDHILRLTPSNPGPPNVRHPSQPQTGFAVPPLGGLVSVQLPL
jgi:hypothetical protein